MSEPHEPAFPAVDEMEGMTFRQWMVGMVASSMVGPLLLDALKAGHVDLIEKIPGVIIEHADNIIKRERETSK